MAEKIISPGVFTNEIDQSFLPSAVADIGAALIGPTVKGPAGIPTVVTSYSEFQQKFGDAFKSGSNSFQYLTSHTAEQYLKNSNTLTVVRIMDGTVGPATASILTSGSTSISNDTMASGGLKIATLGNGERFKITDPSGNSKVFISSADGSGDSSDGSIRFFTTGGTLTAMTTNLITEINAEYSTIKASNSGSAAVGGTSIQLSGSALGTAYNGYVFATASAGTPATFGAVTAHVKAHRNTKFTTQGGSGSNGPSVTAFKLKTLADGTIMNNSSANHTGSNNLLLSGSTHNIRYEVVSNNPKKGTFNLVIRTGNDNVKRKQILETFNNVSLDPKTTNYIGKVIGDQRYTVRTDGTTKYLQLTGDSAPKSKYVTVHNINATPEYLDENGNVTTPANSMSLPAIGSGSVNGGFGGGLDGYSGFDALGNPQGSKTGTYNFYENIDGIDSQGYDPDDLIAADGGAAYSEALDLLANQDEYDINLILAPGIIANTHVSVASKIIDVCESRGDCFAILDPVPHNSTLKVTTTQAETRDSNFAAMYWPWIKVPDNQVGVQRWVPPSVAIGGIYAFNDKVAHPWFAPAGLNRGGIDTAIQAERKLTQGNRDDLYDSNVNPIATFPGQGVTVFGQKTLQKKASALDRINVRRLLIRVKKFIASSSRFLVFEQNTAATRRRFLGIVNPFLEQVQSQSGLSAFRVVMDETNNTPDTIDRNQLVGQLFLQPTRTAEFIVLDFVVQPTGAAFPE